MRRFFFTSPRLFSLALLLLSALALSLLTSPVAKAASQYDDFIAPKITETLINKIDNYSGMSCDEGDRAYTWYSDFKTNNYYPNPDAQWASFDAALNGNGAWAVTYQQINNGDNSSNPYFIKISWVENRDDWVVRFGGSAPNRYVYWTKKDGATGPEMQNVLVGSTKLIQNSGANCTTEFLFNDNNDRLSYSEGQTPKIFLSTFDVEYPAGYDGALIPSSLTETPVIKPSFAYDVISKQITAKDHRLDLPTFTPDEGYTFNGYSVEWTLTKCEAWQDSTNTCSTPQQKDYKIQSQSQNYTYTVADYGEYNLSAQYLVEQCYRYPSYPATPDYCFYVDLQTEFPDVEFLSTTTHLTINGDTIGGDTGEGTCDSSGYCEPAPLYKDCSVYGLDVGGYVSCSIDNFGKFLRNLAIYLFVPTAEQSTALINNGQAFFRDKLGFLYQSMTYGIDLATSFLDSTTDCTVDFEGEFFGAHVGFNFCAFEENFPVAYNIMITLARGALAYMLIRGLFARLNMHLEGFAR